MLWYIVAAMDDFGAILKKGDEEQLYFSYGPGSPVPNAPREEDMELMSEMVALSCIVKGGYVRHSPPLAVENFQEWPEVARKYNRPLRPIEFY